MGTRSAGRSARCMSVWASVPEAPLDPILGMSQRHAADTDPRKVNVSIGAYRTDEGKPLVLNCVKKAEKMMLEDTTLNKEYLPQRGDVVYAQLCQKMIFGADSKLLKDGVVATVQTLSGTGALRLGAEFVKRYAPDGSIIMLHAAAHNPTGVDPTKEQWDQIKAVCQKKKHLCWFDNAYQGYATGYLDKDGYATRSFAESGLQLLVSQSFAKNFGLS